MHQHNPAAALPALNTQTSAKGYDFQILLLNALAYIIHIMNDCGTGYKKNIRQLLQLADLGFLDQDNCRAAVDLLLRSRLTEATAFLLDYCNRRWPRETAGADTDFLDAEFAL